jgi:hypothetical protein
MMSRSQLWRSTLGIAIVAKAISGSTALAGVFWCWRNYSESCCNLIQTGPLPHTTRTCGTTPCPDTITSNPTINHTQLGSWSGTTDSEPIYPECICRWRFRYCNTQNQCITTDIFTTNYGLGSVTIGDACSP